MCLKRGVVIGDDWSGWELSAPDITNRFHHHPAPHHVFYVLYNSLICLAVLKDGSFIAFEVFSEYRIISNVIR